MRGDGRVFQRGQIWWVAYYHDGREHRESSKSREHKEAVRLLRQRVGEAAAGTVQRRPGYRRAGTRAVTMHDLFDLLEQYYQLNSRSSPINGFCLRRLRRRFAGYTVQGCTSLAISHYMAAMQREGRKAPTINREIAVLHSAFRLGYRHDLVARVPGIKLLPDHAVRNEFFTRAEIDALFPCLREYLRDVVLFAFLTGWRKGEIIGLQWGNVNRSGRGHPAGAGAEQEPNGASSRTARGTGGVDRTALARPQGRADTGTACFPPCRRTTDGVPSALAGGLPSSRSGRPHVSQPPTQRGPKHVPAGRSREGHHVDHGAQDAGDVRPLQHRDGS